MMRTPEGFTFWAKYYRAASILPDKKRLQFYDALLEMGCSGNGDVETGDEQIDSLLEMIMYEVIASHNRVSAGVKGGNASTSKTPKKSKVLKEANEDKKSDLLTEAKSGDDAEVLKEAKEQPDEDLLGEAYIGIGIGKGISKGIDYTTPPF